MPVHKSGDANNGHPPGRLTRRSFAWVANEEKESVNRGFSKNVRSSNGNVQASKTKLSQAM
eukprot:7602024-Karenia_brevis.AAC.1